MRTEWQQWLFRVAAAYDGILGITFLLFWRRFYELFGVTPPNHPGYVQFPALLLVLFGVMFLRISQNPTARRELIAYGIGLKTSYCGLVFWYQLTTGLPSMWIPWAWIDVVFLALFVMALQRTPALRQT
jgi:hypothetical protein